MFRESYKTLVEWKTEYGRKPLLLRGARQIGKSHLVKTLGKNEFDNYIVINFDKYPEHKEIFNSFEPEIIVQKIELFTKQKVILGKTLIFLDEIQECPRAIVALRYLYEDLPELHVIGAGSLLEFCLSAEDFRMPVGRIQYLYLYPMSFSEFLIALGEDKLQQHILSKSNFRKLPLELHLRLIEHVKTYYIVGGMPEAVATYVKTKNIGKCQKIQRSIIQTYKDDFAKYASHIQFKYLQKIFNTIPALIGGKITYTKIDDTIKSRDLKNAFDLLETAGILYKVKKTPGSGIPLEVGATEKTYKAIFLDIGLMNSINGLTREIAMSKNIVDVYKGALAEQFVGQELITLNDIYTDAKLYYWSRDAKSSTAELDFLINIDSKVVPVEIKSGKKGTLKSLKLFQDKHKPEQSIRIYQGRYIEEDGLTSIPFYGMKTFIKLNYEDDIFFD